MHKSIEILHRFQEVPGAFCAKGIHANVEKRYVEHVYREPSWRCSINQDRKNSSFPFQTPQLPCSKLKARRRDTSRWDRVLEGKAGSRTQVLFMPAQGRSLSRIEAPSIPPGLASRMLQPSTFRLFSKVDVSSRALRDSGS